MKQLCSIALIALVIVFSSGAVTADDVQFDVIQSYVTLHYAYAAFCPPDRLAAWNCEWCIPGFTFLRMLTANSTNTYGYIGYDVANATVHIGFRGTVGWQNILDDLEFFKTSDYPDIPGARVHDGFNRAYEAVRYNTRAAVRQILTDLCPHCSTIIFTGHSLGAAISGLAAVDIALFLQQERLNNTVKCRLNNFGMPRVGNDKFAEGFAALIDISQSWRVVHNKDIVPHLPPRDLNFHQVRTEIWNKDDIRMTLPQQHRLSPIPNSGASAFVHVVGDATEQYITCNSSGEDRKCSDGEVVDYVPIDHMTYMGVHNDNCGKDWPPV